MMRFYKQPIVSRTRTMAAGASSSTSPTIHWVPQWVSENTFRQHGIDIHRAEGVYMFDSEGRRVVDFYSQVMATSLGHGLPILADAVQKQAEEVSFLNTIKFIHPTVSQYSEKLAGVLPDSINRIFFTVSGAESTEAAIKVARQVTGRSKVLYRDLSYHGASYGALSVSGDPRSKIIEGFSMPHTVPIPHSAGYTDPAEEVEEYIKQVENIIKAEGPESIACLLAETVTGGSGMLMPAPGLFQRLRELLDKYGILLVADEVMTGFGRTGTMWAFEQENYTPDIVTMAKGINNGTCPLGAVAIADHVAAFYQDKPFPHGATNSTHLVSIAAANATLDYMISNRVVEGVAAREAILRSRLVSLCEKGAAKSFRLRGLMGAIVLNPPESANSGTSEALFMDNASLLDALYKRGVYTLMKDNLLLIGPPLIISEQELHEAMDAIEEVLLSILSPAEHKSGVPLNQAQMWDKVTVDKWRATTSKLDYAYDSAATYIRSLVQDPASSLIFEIGSGTGEMISQFEGSFGSCWGLEYQKDFAEACKASFPGINIIHGDAKQLSQVVPADFASGFNEIIFICLTNTLGNMSSADMCKIVNEMIAVLPDRGEIILGFTAKEHFDTVVQSVFQTNPDLFGEVSRNDDSGEIFTSTGYYSKLYDQKELAELLGNGWTFETVGKNIYCRFTKPSRKAQLYYDDQKNLEIHSVLGNNEMHVGLYAETPDLALTAGVDRTTMVAAEKNATNRLLDISKIHPQSVIAEFGSGFGNAANLALLRPSAPELYCCIDISATNMNVARAANAHHPQERIQYLVKDFSDTGLPDESVDVVLSQDSLLHATAVMDRVLGEAFRILKPGGRFVFTDIMQSPDVELSAALAARLGMKSLVTPDLYKELAHKAGLTFSRFDDMSHNLEMHYRSFQNQVRSHVDEEKVDPSYIDRYAQGLQVWIDGAKDLRWGFMEFLKLPPNCRRVEYPWVHFLNHCSQEDVNERFRTRVELSSDLQPSNITTDRGGFTIQWGDSAPPTQIQFGAKNEFLEDVNIWAVDSICPKEESICCWVTDAHMGVLETPPSVGSVLPADSSLDFVQFKGASDEHFRKYTELGLTLREMPVETETFLNRPSKQSAIGWHTDNSFYYNPPQFVCLFGETIEEPTPTYFVDGRKVVEQMKQKHPEQYQLLRTQPLYMARAIHSDEHDIRVSIVPRHVINDNGEIFLSCITQRVPSQYANCAEMYDALKTFELLCDEMRFSVDIAEGEGVCFNNRRFLHSRAPVNGGRVIKYSSFHAPLPDGLGVIGLGAMGLPLCNHLASLYAAGKVNSKCGGFDVDLGRINESLDAKVTRHESVTTLCKEADTVFLFLPDDSSTKSCVQDIINTPHPRKRLVINMGTTSPECSMWLQQILGSKGHQFCEAPVSGGPAAVAKGQLTIMYACDEATYARATEVLQLVSDNLVFCGAIGTASAVKICNNFCVAGNMLAFSIAAQTANAMSCSGSLLSRVLNKSAGRSWCSEVHNPIPGIVSTAPSSDNYRPGFQARHMCKDISLFVDSASKVGMATPFGSAVEHAYKSLAHQYPTLDFSSVYSHAAIPDNDADANHMAGPLKQKIDPSTAASDMVEILLQHDKRGMRSIVEQGHVPGGGYFGAADLILTQSPGTCLIVTGSYIPAAKASETDGPPGAIVLGNALTKLGFTPVYVTDKFSRDVMTACAKDTGARVVIFPEGDLAASQTFARGLLAGLNPTLLCAVERLGRCSDGTYRNMLGEDVSSWNAPADTLFDDLGFSPKVPSIGVFDGGNEAGCGTLVKSGAIPSVVDPSNCLVDGSVVDTTVQVTGTTSNWGAFGVVTALALSTNKPELLPDAESTWALTQQALNAGAVDGINHGNPSVDGHDKETNIKCVEKLHQLLSLYEISPK